MINEICIKSCTPYDDLGANISNCKKVNFIYGANGSGKTTISEYLRTYGINSDRYKFCHIKWESNNKTPIYVYNRQFRQNNFKNEVGIPGVFTLGEDSIEDIEAIKKLKEDLRKKEEKYNKTKESIEKKNYEKEELEKILRKMHGNKFLNVMKTILVMHLKVLEEIKINLLKNYKDVSKILMEN